MHACMQASKPEIICDLSPNDQLNKSGAAEQGGGGGGGGAGGAIAPLPPPPPPPLPNIEVGGAQPPLALLSGSYCEGVFFEIAVLSVTVSLNRVSLASQTSLLAIDKPG